MISDHEKIVADLHSLSIFTFVNEGSDGTAELKKAQDYQNHQIQRLENLLNDCNDQSFHAEWANELRRVKVIQYRLVTYGEYKTAERQKMLSYPLYCITEKEFFDALDVLPPMAHEFLENRVERFCMSEFFTGTYTTQYFRFPNGCFSRMVDFCDRTTWITLQEVTEFLSRKEPHNG